MKMHSQLPKLFLFCALLFCTTLIFATSFFIRPFSEFVQSAPNIIRGKPSQIRVQEGVTPQGKTIYTYATLEILDVIKGDISGSQIQIRKLGGTKDGITLAIPSSVEFVENEEGVFFLGTEKEDQSYEVTGMEMGKFGVERKNGEDVLVGGLFAYSKPHAGEHQHAGSPDIAENQRTWSVSELKKLVLTQAPSSSAKKNISNEAEEMPSPTQITTTEENSTDKNSRDLSVPTEEKNNSPLYFERRFWYAMSTLLVVIGFWIYRRRG